MFVRERVAVGSLELAVVAAASALTAWVALSTAWSTSPERSVLETQRTLVYLGALASLVAVARGRSIGELLGALWAAAALAAADGLAHVFFGGHAPAGGRLFRLVEPFGYPNAAALSAAIGALLALSLSAHARSGAARAAASASVVVFALALFFASSRGALLAGAAGLAAAILADGRRVALLRTLAAVAPVAIVAVWVGSRAHGGTTLTSATILLAAAAAGANALAPRLSRLGRSGVAAATAVVVAAAGAAAAFGAGPALARGEHRFVGSGNTSVALSLSGRVPLWREAWQDWEAHPVAGAGAGTFELYWVAHRKTSAVARDAHSLYLETLAELGPLGLALLLALLAVPPVAAIRARGDPLVAGAFGAYVAFVVHAAGDWDWEMPAVTILGLLCGTAVVLAARPGRPRPLSPRSRVLATAVSTALALFACAGLIGNGALAASGRTAAAGRWRESEAQARRAARWLPWSGEAWWRRAVAESNVGEPSAARSSVREAISKDPNEWRPWVTLLRLTRGRAQRRALREAARLNPRDRQVAQFLLAPGSLNVPSDYDDSWTGWPVAPVHQPHPIRAAFLVPRAGTLRKGGAAAYHFGVDVGVRDDRPEPGAPPGRTHRVYAIEGGTAELPVRRGACVDGKVLVDHFSYWHVDATVADGQRVEPGEAIGWTCKGLWHVHVAELLDLYGRSVYVNPLRPGGKLGPAPDDTPPRVRAIRFFGPAMPRWRVNGGVSLPPAGTPMPAAGGRPTLHGRVDVRAWIDDPPSARIPVPLRSPSPPYRVSLEVLRESEGIRRPVLVRTVFRSAVFLADSTGTQTVPLDYHYAPGTSGTLPAALCVELRRRDCGGTYWFRLFGRPTSAYWDTRKLRDGVYRLRVTASDAAGNTASRDARVTIRNART